jgi:hypothetical protein
MNVKGNPKITDHLHVEEILFIGWGSSHVLRIGE